MAPATSSSGCAKGWPGCRASSARSTTRASSSLDLEIQAPSLDDVFLAKTGRSLEGAGEDEQDEAETAA